MVGDYKGKPDVKKKKYLTAMLVNNLHNQGMYCDNLNNLYLQIDKSGIKSWIFRYSRNGKRRYMGLGRSDLVSLLTARNTAAEIYKKLKEDSNFDPIEHRKSEQLHKLLEKTNIVTFDFCAEKYIDSHRNCWKNPKHIQQWENTLRDYASPIIGNLPIKDIDTRLLIQILEPIWELKTETASRLRGRIENILDWAITHKYRDGDNPARWKNHLENILAKPSRIRKVKHHKALPYRQIYECVQKIQKSKSISALALEFLILTASRTNEVIKATWDEIDIEHKIWIIPGERMKAEKEHRVPLVNRSLKIVNHLYCLRQSNFIFPSNKQNKGLSNAAMDKLLQVTLEYEYTVHGFRSTFRDWAAELTYHPHDLCEMALAHTIKNNAEKAYRRGDMIEKRRKLMIDWQKYIETPPAE